jgi:hypothetical protein
MKKQSANNNIRHPKPQPLLASPLSAPRSIPAGGSFLACASCCRYCRSGLGLRVPDFKDTWELIARIRAEESNILAEPRVIPPEARSKLEVLKKGGPCVK